MTYVLQLTHPSGVVTEVPDVEEFVAGNKYLFVQTRTSTLSFDRDGLLAVRRRVTGTSDCLPVLMRKQKPPVVGHRGSASSQPEVGTSSIVKGPVGRHLATPLR